MESASSFAQSYYSGHIKDGKFELDGVMGDIKSAGGLVLAAGSIHPDSKEEYHVIVDANIASLYQASWSRAASRKPMHPASVNGHCLYMMAKAGMTSSFSKLDACAMPVPMKTPSCCTFRNSMKIRQSWQTPGRMLTLNFEDLRVCLSTEVAKNPSQPQHALSALFCIN